MRRDNDLLREALRRELSRERHEAKRWDEDYRRDRLLEREALERLQEAARRTV